MAVEIKRGTNISHWLSQSDRRGAERAAFFTQDDVKRLADWGFDHLRIPIDEEQMWSESGQPESEAFDLLNQALDWLDRAGMNAVVDLHILRSHHFNQEGQPALFGDPAEAQHLADLWRQLSAHLHQRPLNRVAYEVLNEAVAKDPRDWNRVSRVAFDAIRALEPGRTIVLGSNQADSVFTFDALDVPDDPDIVLTFHYYHPMLLTHYTASWWRDGGFYNGPVQYPGRPIASAAWEKLSAADRERLKDFNVTYNPERIEADFSQPLAAARRTGLPLYCGEFGVVNYAPHETRLAWYRDIMGVFERYDIGWANWDYKGLFGLIADGNLSTGIAETMLGSLRGRKPALV